MMTPFLIVLLALSLFIVARSFPLGHDKLGRSMKEQTHEVVFVVRMNNQELLFDKAREVSDPVSAKYLKHWSKKEVDDFISNPEGTRAVRELLRENPGLVEMTNKASSGGAETFLHVQGTIGQFETLFEAEFHDWRHTQQQTVYSRSETMEMPASLTDHVDAVLNVADFNPPFITRAKGGDYTLEKMTAAAATATAATAKAEVAADATYPSAPKPSNQPSNPTAPYMVGNFILSFLGISSVLGVSNYSANVNTDVSIMIYETTGQNYQPNALQSFIKQNSLVSGGDVQYYGVPGHNENDIEACGKYANGCGEANLDMQYAAVSGNGIKQMIYFENSNNSFLSQWSMDMATMESVPDVVSISYGSPEIAVDPNVLRVVDNNLLIMGLRGTTVFASSGDNGVTSSLSKDFNQSTEAESCNVGYMPAWPASAPYVTAVGATQGPEADKGAVVCSNAASGGITSGGGFSWWYNATWYQEDAISKYIATNPIIAGPGIDSTLAAYFDDPNLPQSYDNNGNIYNTLRGNSAAILRKGAGYPDIATLGHNFNVSFFITSDTSFQGKLPLKYYTEADGTYMYVPVDGTSASSPTMAGLFAQIVAKRKRSGLGPLGWINPTLYSAEASLFTDVTLGINNCNEDNFCCDFGYQAAEGWDPATGWGQVKFAEALALFGNNSYGTPGRGGGGGSESSYSSNNNAGTSETTVIIIVCACLIALLGLGLLVSYHLRSKDATSRNASAAAAAGGNTVSTTVRNPIPVAHDKL